MTTHQLTETSHVWAYSPEAGAYECLECGMYSDHSEDTDEPEWDDQ